jgi:hypothetical protein
MKLIRCALACILGATVALAAETSLFSLRMGSRSENHATDYSVTFNEISRTTATSLIEMVYTPPRLSPDLGEVTTGMCLLLKSRAAQIVQVAVVSTDPIRFEASFPPPNPEAAMNCLHLVWSQHANGRRYSTHCSAPRSRASLIRAVRRQQ